MVIEYFYSTHRTICRKQDEMADGAFSSFGDGRNRDADMEGQAELCLPILPTIRVVGE